MFRFAFCVPFFLPLLTSSVAGDAIINSPYSPTDYFLLDCGSSENTTTSSDSRTWGPDHLNSPSSKFSSSNHNASPNVLTFESTADRQQAAVDQVPYMTARIFNSTQFTYTFPVSPGPKFLRLYFYPAVYSGIHESDFFFTVTSGVYTLLSNFSASLAVAAAMEPQLDSIIVKEFCIHVWENQSTLNITFSPSPSFYGFVNGIEVCSMPNNLYTRGDGQPIPLLGSNYLFYIDNYTALETVHRLNVGGASLGGERDTGMFRNWRDDSSYISGAAFGVTWQRNDTDIRYTPATPAYTAPTEVYSSSRSMGPVVRINLNYNLTWIFPVDCGFYYLVRLHFCEVEDVTRVNERVFDIFLNNQTAQEEADVIAWSGGTGIPIYQEYVVYTKQQDLSLVLHPNMDSKPHFADAILNGVEIFKLNRSHGSLASPNPQSEPVPLPLPVVQPQNNSSNSSSKGPLSELFIILAAAAVLFFGILALLSFVHFSIVRKRRRVWCWCWVSGEANLTSLRQGGSTLPNEICRRYTLSDLQEATNDFDDVLLIGRGGFGDVYRGCICVDGGDVVVAIKRLKPMSKQGAHEFVTEIEMLSQLRHQHLVSLMGYCEEEGEMILVYDYMHHGTLGDHLYGGGGGGGGGGADHDHRLPWKRRLEICIGAARGLEYLHAGARQPIIHRDIKSTNILLDHKWVAKVSDFGLSKVGVGPTHDTAVSTIVKGTFGYMDPEYCKTMMLTQKSDVYSFGVVLLEVICGRAAVDRSLEYEQISLANWARGCIENGRLDEIIDPLVVGQIAEDCLKKFGETAFECLRDQGIQRPTMVDVIARLELALKLQDDADATAECSDLRSTNNACVKDVIMWKRLE